jgi:hypothetical protein
MCFRAWLNESTHSELYSSAVEAFPNTTKRQHAIDPIKISRIQWSPFLGVKTLVVKGLAQNEDREYSPMIVFKGVKYHPEKDASNLVTLATEGKVFYLEPISLSDNHVLLRCQCGDFHWRFCHTDHLDRSLQGPNRKKYEALYRPGSANPKEMPGMCKHILKLAKVLSQTSLVK